MRIPTLTKLALVLTLVIIPARIPAAEASQLRIDATNIHYETPGEAWEPMSSGTTVTLTGIWGSSSSDVFAVGDAGTILHYNGSAWSQMDSGTGTYLTDVWGSSGNDVFAVGGDGIFHYDGITWSHIDTVSWAFGSVWGFSPQDVYAVTGGGICHYDGYSWSVTPFSFPGRMVQGIWGTSPSDMFFAVNSGIYQYDGTSCSVMLGGSNFWGVWGFAGDDVFAVTSMLDIFHYDGSVWTTMWKPDWENGYLVDIWGTSSSSVFALGVRSSAQGHFSGVFHYDGSTWSQIETGTSSELFEIWGTSDSNLFVVGGYGTILHYGHLAPVASFAASPLEGATPLAVSFTDQSTGDISSWLWSFGDGETSTERNPVHSYYKVGTYGVSLTVNGTDTETKDEYVTVVNSTPVLGSIVAPTEPISTNTAITASAVFSDANSEDTHVAVWDWGDGTTSEGMISESNGYGEVNGSHTYTENGVYVIGLTLADSHGAQDQESLQYMVIYDSNSSVYGHGRINSPAGAYAADPLLAGRADFGFVSKYKKGANVPDGNTEFQFKAGDLSFESTSYDWLVVAGNKAQFKGVGTINGSGEYKFMLTANDSPDTFRIKIWDPATDEVVYDNKVDTALGGGSIVIHK